mmetsp:Transcript_11410/g.37365  ORF Transcript_11410/g.37365 Transcript_11410/m.37365 type:complete len:211 (-) Transcript_11410:1009-1641(-)
MLRRASPLTGMLVSGGWATTRKLETAPRASKCSLIGPPSACAAGARRGTRRTPSLTDISGSECWPPLSADRAADSSKFADAVTSRHESLAVGDSCRAERARPITPAKDGCAELPWLDACAPEVSSHVGTGLPCSCCRTRSNAASMPGSIAGETPPLSIVSEKRTLLGAEGWPRPLLPAARRAAEVPPSVSAGEKVSVPAAGASSASHCVT